MGKSVESLDLAVHATLQRVLNAFIREQEIALHIADTSDLPAPEVGMQRFALPLPRHGGYLYGDLIYRSPSGYHHYGQRFWHRPLADAVPHALENWQALVELLLNELAGEPGQKRELALRIGNSIEKTAHSVQWHQSRPYREYSADEHWAQMRDAEQALIFGHPFHPSPKSAEGWLSQHSQQYAPELGASFRLHYFALACHLVHDEKVAGLWLDDIIPHTIHMEVAAEQHQYCLFPCHPWQATFLLEQAAIQTLCARNELVYCGPLQQEVYPTSSVRTVCDPTHHTIYKLPLHVRITNFVRTNPLEQLERSLAASKLLRAVQRTWPYADFHVILERGYRRPHLPWMATEEQALLIENLAVLFRQQLGGLVNGATTGGALLVLASLLEPGVNGQEPVLLRAIRSLGKGQVTAGLLESWLRRYLDISLLPLLRLFSDYAISLEAHVQNTLVQLDGGWPGRMYVRDMEGVSVSRERLQCRDLLRPDSPVLLDDQEAWQRLQYYFFTNHLSHLLHTLAYYGQHDERALWSVVRQHLEREMKLHESPYVEDLLTKPTLPAKAHLVSCLWKRSEHPMYVGVPNLMASKER
jgi:siderophore synthetase component